MTGYTKLFSQIVTSTIWQEPNDCRVLWITMLALKEADHVCRATIPALAKLCGISNELCEKYLAKFMEPDKYSRSQEHKGRRIKKVEDGWFILNGPKYREKMNAEDRRAQVAKNVAAHRARAKAGKSKTVRVKLSGEDLILNGVQRTPHDRLAPHGEDAR